jgi:hypothetical protein
MTETNYDPAALDALMGHQAMQALLRVVAALVGAEYESFHPAIVCSNKSIYVDASGPNGRVEFTVSQPTVQ